MDMTPAFSGFQFSRTPENREAYRRALREARLEENPWLVPLKGSNETEYRKPSHVRASKPNFSLQSYFRRIHQTGQDSIDLLASGISQHQVIQLEPPEKVHQRTQDRIENLSAKQGPSAERNNIGHTRSFLYRFLSLPPELRLMILERLHFGDIDRLRRTCRSFRTVIDKPTIIAVFPDLSEVLTTTCRHCLGTDRSARLIIKEKDDHPLQPLGNQCWRCAARHKEYRIGKQYRMVDETKGFFCRWCGYPCIRAGRLGQTWSQYHKPCYRRRIKAMLFYMFAGTIQWLANLGALGMCWICFHEHAVITGPTVAILFASIWALLLTIVRGSRLRTFHWSVLLEVIILALWVPPTFAIATIIRSPSSRSPGPPIMTLALVGINILLRILNVVGCVALTCEYKAWQRKRPGRNVFQRCMSSTLFLIMLWTWGQSTDLEYPPKWRLWRSSHSSPVSV